MDNSGWKWMKWMDFKIQTLCVQRSKILQKSTKILFCFILFMAGMKCPLKIALREHFGHLKIALREHFGHSKIALREHFFDFSCIIQRFTVFLQKFKNHKYD